MKNTDDERLGKAAFEGFYKTSRIHVSIVWEDQSSETKKCWIAAAKTAIKEKDRLKWEETQEHARILG